MDNNKQIINFTAYLLPLTVKKIVAIIAFLLFAFYSIGYYFVYKIVQYKNEQITSRQLDNGNYNGAQIVFLKVPVNLPYLPQSTPEERASGNIIINGKLYIEVSKRLINDTLYIKCAQDNRQQALSGMLHDFIAFTFGNMPITNHHTDWLTKSLLKEFLPLSNFAFLQADFYSKNLYSRLMVNLPASLFADKDTPPPRLI